jgi:hypothetical protein
MQVLQRQNKAINCSWFILHRIVSCIKVFNYIFRNRNEWSHLQSNSLLTWERERERDRQLLVASPPTWHVPATPAHDRLIGWQGTPLSPPIDLQIAPDTFHHFVVPPTRKKNCIGASAHPFNRMFPCCMCVWYGWGCNWMAAPVFDSSTSPSHLDNHCAV